MTINLCMGNSTIQMDNLWIHVSVIYKKNLMVKLNQVLILPSNNRVSLQISQETLPRPVTHEWSQFALDSVVTTFVQITVLSTYDSGFVYLNEIELYEGKA